MHDDVRAVDESSHCRGVTDISAELLDRRLQLAIVQRHDVECADVVAVVEQATGEMEAEKAGPA